MEPLDAIEPETELTPTTTALEQYERAQIDVQIATAKKWPRKELSIIRPKLMAKATADIETAEGCFYSLRRKSKDGIKEIRGPSIHLAVMGASVYGNLKSGSRVIANDGKTITAQGMCVDLENNISVVLEVKRRITDKYGQTFSEDMQVVTGNAACSIALRNAILKILPDSLIKPVYERTIKVAVGDAKTLSSRCQAAIEKFSKMGVSKERILKVLEHSSVEEINLEDLEYLTSLRNEIRDDLKTIEEAFPVEPKITKPVFNTPDPQSKAAPQEREPTPASSANLSVTDSIPTANAEGGAASALDPLEMDAPAALEELNKLMAEAGLNEENLIAYCQDKGIASKKIKHLRELSLTKLLDLALNFSETAIEIKGGV